MARTTRKPRKKSKCGKDSKELRKRLDKEREEQRERTSKKRTDPYQSFREAMAAEFGCPEEDLGECMRCGSPWPSGMKNCPECGWDGLDLAFMFPMPQPQMWS
jgi:hypothetical protein